MHRIKKKLEPSAADTEPITNLRCEGKALQIETIDQDSEFTESASLFDYEKSKSTASSTLNYFSWVIYSSGNILRRCPKFGFHIKCIQTSYNIAGNISRFEYRFPMCKLK